MYESPRWLVEHGKSRAALKTLQFYREGYFTADEVHDELVDIERSVAAFRATGLKSSSLFTDPGLFARLWRAALLQFMAQMCGATAMKYYLPVLFKALGLSPRVSLLAGGIESTLKIVCTVVEMLIIDKIGRRLTLAAGAAVMAFALMVSVCPLDSFSRLVVVRSPAVRDADILQINGTLPLIYPGNVNRVADYICVVFIFIFAFGYSMGFGPAAWVYGSEVSKA